MSSEATTTTTLVTSTPGSGGFPLTVVVGAVGGFIIAVCIIVIIVVAVFVRKSKREIKQTAEAQRHLKKPVTGQPQIQHHYLQEIREVETRTPKTRVEYQNTGNERSSNVDGIYVKVSPDQALTAGGPEVGESAGSRVVYAVLDFEKEQAYTNSQHQIESNAKVKVEGKCASNAERTSEAISISGVDHPTGPHEA